MLKHDTSKRDNPPQHLADLVSEIPVAIAVNALSVTVLMASPFDIEDLVTGFLFTAGILASRNELKDISVTANENDIHVDCALTGRREYLLKQRRFGVAGGGCGICNTSALEDAFPPMQTLPDTPMKVLPDYAQLRERVSQQQQYRAKSGALHAAMFWCPQRNIEICREDIGRHNALDKVIGATLNNKIAPEDGMLIVTSRCGVELVQKAIAGGFRMLVSFSSPTDFAVRFAQTHNLHLVYLPRNNQPVFFSPRGQL